MKTRKDIIIDYDTYHREQEALKNLSEKEQIEYHEKGYQDGYRTAIDLVKSVMMLVPEEEKENIEQFIKFNAANKETSDLLMRLLYLLENK